MEQDKLVIRPKRAKGDDGFKTFSIRIREELAENLDQISAKTGHSRNELIGIFLEYALEHCVVSDK